MKISLIISTYNRPDTLELVLMSVAKQIIPSGLVLEVLVADDGSGIETKSLVTRFQQDFPFELLHIWHEDLGFRLAAIRNLATSKSSGEYLIFIDGDCLIAPDFILNQTQLAEKGCFVGGNRVLLSESYTESVLNNKLINIATTSVISSILARLSGKTNKWLPALRLNPLASWRKKYVQNWRRPKGCNMALWRQDCLAVNGFDEGFAGWGHEDADFLVRLLHAGIQIKDGRFAAPVYHLWHKVNDRSNEAENMARLMERVNDKDFIRAADGVDKYLTNKA
ncbi:MAG: glycosyltransferase [Neisseriales bacterium]|nr:MAG: glycosyltransferase [Neisseriales bacterium]